MQQPAPSPPPHDSLAEFWKACLGKLPEQSLENLLAAHPAAAARLTDALLEMGPQATEPLPTAPLGDGENSIGPYRLVRELGRGGQAVVHQAIDSRLGRTVALKVLRSDMFRSRRAEDRFRAEAATTSRLDHRGICPIYDIGRADDLLYIAMRFVDGETLSARIAAANAGCAGDQAFELRFTDGLASESHHDETGARRLRPWLQTIRFFESAAAALHAAHLAGIAHRDIKPGNVMVQRDGTAVILDFGLANDDSRDGATLTRSGEVFGTPAYMAPEQCRDARDGDARSDVFALGATLFEALTGKRAFEAATPEAAIRKILSGRIPDPCRSARGLPREFGVIVGKAMDPEPARRYATAAAFGDDLQRLREQRPILAEPPSLSLRTRRWVQRNPLLTALLAVALVGTTTTELAWQQAAATAKDNQLLATPQILAELRSEGESLNPIRDQRDRAKSWLGRARGMHDQQVALRTLIAELRQRALPARPEDAPGRLHPARLEVERLDHIERSLAAGLGRQDALEELRKDTAVRAQDREVAAQRLADARAYRFTGADDQLRHDSLVRLLADLAEFGGPDGPIVAIDREIKELDSERATDWQATSISIASLPVYRGLQLTPQAGLRPLRCNLQSGFWEFTHLRSGEPPTVRADGTLQVTEATGIVLVLMPGGSYAAGAQSREPDASRYVKERRDTEDFLVRIDVDPFFLATHEITQAQWLRLAHDKPSTYQPGATNQGQPLRITLCNPVETVPWNHAVRALARSGLTLPTEAQWEIGARAGTDTEWWTGEPLELQRCENLRDQAAARAKFTGLHELESWDDGWPCHAPVGSLRPNPYGFYDMLGNVQEWCLDDEAYPNYDLLRPGDGRWLAPVSDKHPLRGGSFGTNARWSRVQLRTLTTAFDSNKGMRAARAIQ